MTLTESSFDVQVILFQAAEACTCRGITHPSFSSAVRCSDFWVILSPGKNMFLHVIEEA